MKIEELMFVEYKHINKKEIEVKVSIDYNYLKKEISKSERGFLNYDNSPYGLYWYENKKDIIHFYIKEYSFILNCETYKRVLLYRTKKCFSKKLIHNYLCMYELEFNMDFWYGEIFGIRNESENVSRDKDFGKGVIVSPEYITLTKNYKISDIKKQLKQIKQNDIPRR